MIPHALAASVVLPLVATTALALQDDSKEAPKKKAPAPEVVVPDEAGIDSAYAAAVAYLLSTQENYVADPPVRPMPDERVPRWQERESERLEKQREDDGPGVEWPYQGVYRVQVGREVIIPSGYRVGGTAIVCEALIAAPDFAEDEARVAALSRSLEFLAQMLDPETGDRFMVPGPKEGYDVRGWGHAQALALFLRVLALDEEASFPTEEQRASLAGLVPHLIHCLAVNEEPGGGWNYAGGAVSPFMTATTLDALMDARDAGFDVEEALIERALDALERNRADNGAFAYSGPARGRVAMHASCARSAAAELVLLRAGRSDADRLHVAVLGFFDGWDELLVRKSQQGTHVGPYAIAPYYFMYGHTWAARAIAALDDERRPELRERLLEHLWRTREGDGIWNDRIFPRSASYGTAMAVLALAAESRSGESHSGESQSDE